MTPAGNSAGTRTGPVARSSVARVGVATAITAVCGYAVLYLAARALDPAGFSVFAVFWGALGLVTGAANGLLQEATREVRAVTTAARVREVLAVLGGHRGLHRVRRSAVVIDPTCGEEVVRERGDELR